MSPGLVIDLKAQTHECGGKNDEFPALRSVLEHYREPELGKSLSQLLSSIFFLCTLWIAMWYTLRYAYIFTLILALPTAGFMLRLFLIQHDCGHGTFFRSRFANDCLGFCLGILTLTPYYHWRRNHSLHHAHAGNLDRRGDGDIYTLTVHEYLALPLFRQFAYRVFRNPLFLFGVGPVIHFLIRQRLPYCSRHWVRERINVYITDILIVLVFGTFSWLIGLRALVLIQLPVLAIGASIGVWLFFVQHHFYGTYWQHNDKWAYSAAGMKGSSYYALPVILQWFTANIGFHHIHHLDSRIPNYRLQKCFDENR